MPACTSPGRDPLASADGSPDSEETFREAATWPPRRWTINGDFLGLKPTGIARFGREVTLALDALIADRHPLTRGLAVEIVAPRTPRDPLALHHIPIRIVPEYRLRLPQVWVQVQLGRHVRGGLLSFCNLAPIRAARHIACIHDLQTRTAPESYGFIFRLVHRLILPRLARRAALITTVSESSKASFVAHGLVPAERVAVVYNGSDHALRWRAAGALRTWPLERPFVLCIARDETHKNMRLLWRMADPLRALGIDIVAVGDFDPAGIDPGRPEIPSNVHCLGRVSDDELRGLFGQALCFAFPSRTEGFGLPAIEAMACDCPVIASTAPCLPEICGHAALYADPDDVPAWVAGVRAILLKPGLRQSLCDSGRQRAARFSWRATALSYLGLMQQVDQQT